MKTFINSIQHSNEADKSETMLNYTNNWQFLFLSQREMKFSVSQDQPVAVAERKSTTYKKPYH